MCTCVCSVFTSTESRQSAEKWQTDRKKSNERNAKIRKGRERERESPAVFPIRRRRPPHWVIYSLSSPSCPNSQTHPPHPTLAFVSFILSLRLRSVGSLWTRAYVEMTTEIHSGQAVLLKWLTCKCWGSAPKSFSQFSFSFFSIRPGRLVSLLDEADRHLVIKHIFF